MTQNNKKSKKQFFSVAGIDWEDDASIDAWAKAVWGVMNTQREEEMTSKKIEAPEPTVKLTGKYARAVSYANKHHKMQARKAKDVPYISHLLAVSALVLEAGGDEDQAIGGLLHDVAEDQGGEARLTEVKERFGERVEAIVRGCSDSITEDPTEKEDWLMRKRQYLSHLKTAAPDTLIVSAADKLHNSRDTLVDIKKEGIGTLDRFNGKAEGTVAYYTAIWLTLTKAGAPTLLTDQLQDIAQQMVDAYYPAEGYDITEENAQTEITKLLLGKD